MARQSKSTTKKPSQKSSDRPFTKEQFFSDSKKVSTVQRMPNLLNPLTNLIKPSKEDMLFILPVVKVNCVCVCIAYNVHLLCMVYAVVFIAHFTNLVITQKFVCKDHRPR